jgi:hypothetical protein
MDEKDAHPAYGLEMHALPSRLDPEDGRQTARLPQVQVAVLGSAAAAQETPDALTPPWQTAYERAARETGLIVFAAAVVILGGLALLLRLALR